MRLRTLLSGCLLTAILISAGAQVPRKFNYQAVARDDQGMPLVEMPVDVKLGILRGGEEGTLVWEEVHNATTSALGLFSVIAGSEEAQKTGGDLAAFADINWAADTYYMQVSIDAGDGFTDMGTVPFLSVPYALHAGNTPQTPWQDHGNSISYTDGLVGAGTETPLEQLHVDGRLRMENDIQVWRDTMAVVIRQDGSQSYISNMRDFVSNGAGDNGWLHLHGQKGVRLRYGDQKPVGVTGLSVSDEGVIRFNGPVHYDNNGTIWYQNTVPEGVPSNDGYRVRWERNYFSTHAEALLFEKTDGNAVNPDGGIVFVNTGNDGVEEPALTIRGNGHLSVGSLETPNKLMVESDDDWDDETPIFQVRNKHGIPVFAVYNNGVEVNFLDDQSVKGVKGGFAVGGYQTGGKGSFTKPYLKINPDTTRLYINTDDPSKGVKGGFAVGGYQTQGKGETASYIYMDPSAKELSSGEMGDIFLSLYSPIGNCYLGTLAGQNRRGQFNTALGYQSLYNATAYSDPMDPMMLPDHSRTNVAIGAFAGYSNTTADGNVFIGYQAGYNWTGSNSLFIENSDADNPLIFGDFNTDDVAIYGDLYYTGNLSHISDIRLKTGLIRLDNVLQKLARVGGYYYQWKPEKTGDMSVDDRRQIGLVAQELEQEFPELISTDRDGYKNIDYVSFTAVLLEAVKEQQAILEKQDEQSARQQVRIEAMEAELEELRSMVTILAEE